MDFTFLVGGVKFDGEPPAPPIPSSFPSGIPARAFSVIGNRQYQADAGSCTAHGYSAAIEAHVKRTTGADFQVSRQDMYLQSRAMERNGAESRDGGAYPSKVREGIRTRGLVSEARKKYVPHDVTTWRRPAAWDADAMLLACRFDPIAPNAVAILPILAEGGTVPYCHMVFDSINRVGQDGIERGVVGPVMGGHCRIFVGYDMDIGLLSMNSWRGWGAGHPTRPELADSFSWIPFDVANDPRWLQDAAVLAVPPVVMP